MCGGARVTRSSYGNQPAGPVAAIVDIIIRLARGHELSTRRTAEQYGVSIRTAERYIALAGRYVALTSPRPGVYRATEDS